MHPQNLVQVLFRHRGGGRSQAGTMSEDQPGQNTMNPEQAEDEEQPTEGQAEDAPPVNTRSEYDTDVEPDSRLRSQEQLSHCK